MATEGNEKRGLIETINAPLGFFVLALLIVETFLGVAVSAKQSDPTALWLGVSMFLLVVGIVAVLVWNKPDNLTFDRAAHLTRAQVQLQEGLTQAKKLGEALRDAVFYRGQKQYARAASCYERGTQIDPESIEAHVGLAVMKSYADPNNLDDSIKILDRVLARYPGAERALYNRACLRCLSSSKYTKQQWLTDLGQAISASPPYAIYARSDEDFRNHWDDPEFVRVCGDA